MELALTTVSYNSRHTLPTVVESVLQETVFPQGMRWYFLLQNFTDEAVEQIVDLCKDKVSICIIRFAENIGLSKAMRFIIEQTKYYKYVLHIEDDFKLLKNCVAFSGKKWLVECVDFMERHADVSTVFLRAYATDQERWQYGMTRKIPYVCHKFKDNFNYVDKMKTSERIKKDGITWTHIPTFLFTFNPCLVRNKDYHEKVYPIPTFDLDTKAAGKFGNWGNVEALIMERTRDFKCFWLNAGLFGHMEDLERGKEDGVAF
jgi:glycosyltransferase involved in cell wall biosynthesis